MVWICSLESSVSSNNVFHGDPRRSIFSANLRMVRSRPFFGPSDQSLFSTLSQPLFSTLGQPFSRPRVAFFSRPSVSPCSRPSVLAILQSCVFISRRGSTFRRLLRSSFDQFEPIDNREGSLDGLFANDARDDLELSWRASKINPFVRYSQRLLHILV